MLLQRLARRADFVAASKQGRRAARDGLVLQALRREGQDAARVGFTATKKIGNAVARNRAKRRLREVARLGLQSAPPMGWDLVLIARDATGTMPFARLRADLDAALRKAGVRG